MKGISRVIETINRLVEDGVVERYAIGGAVGATFYLEPVATLDVDIFIAFEHLAAVALQLGRPKDKARLLQFAESGAVDADRFQSILRRHGLIERWREFEKAYLGGAK